MEADIATQSLGLASNTDFSLISLFLRADIIVKSVIIILIVSSIYSWAIIFESVVFPSPGGPYKSIWSNASPLCFAAVI